MVNLLREEAAAVEMQMHLVSENLVNKCNQTMYARLHGRLYDLWDRYEDGDLCTEGFLGACSTIVGLGANPTSATFHDA